MIVHGFDITDALRARLLAHITRMGRFRNADLIAAIRDAAAQQISVSIVNTPYRRGRCRDVGEVCMRSADTLIKHWKKLGVIHQGDKRGDWLANIKA